MPRHPMRERACAGRGPGLRLLLAVGSRAFAVGSRATHGAARGPALPEQLKKVIRGANRTEWLERECQPRRVHRRRPQPGQHEIGNPSLQLPPIVQDLSPCGTAVQVEGPGGRRQRCDIGRGEKAFVRLRVIQPRKTSHLPEFRMKAPYVVKERPQFILAFREIALGERPCSPVPFFRHEVKPQRTLQIGRVVREAPIGRRIPPGRAVVGIHRDPQKVGMPRAASDLVQKTRPHRISRGTPQAKAAPQVGAAGNRLAEVSAGELGIPRGKAKLEVEIVLKQAAAGHMRIIGDLLPTQSRRGDQNRCVTPVVSLRMQRWKTSLSSQASSHLLVASRSCRPQADIRASSSSPEPPDPGRPAAVDHHRRPIRGAEALLR